MLRLLSIFKLIIPLYVISIIFFTNAVIAHDFKKNQIEINHPYINKPFQTSNSAAGYLIIKNHSDKNINLLTVSSTLGKTMVHKTTTSETGVVKMEHLMKLEIPAKGIIVMEPGSYHIMITEISRALVVNELIPATLVFDNEFEVDIEFKVNKHQDISNSGTKKKHSH
ncbi:MAG: copper chaperone PCu(A)C [Paracoccaceae bacterium]|nr:copper chaperone PCu(A)C [Paracoccaceae bacterium]